ncbi:unnamed protein product [Phytophthora lilii]|uniref:Unnamed protein product n=1 Tax=Phytophthora lilii TaxID=2077276 RepID=A0A9W6UDL0_9STRA|nr:unnamed protein product [Phytophthora lilii]
MILTGKKQSDATIRNRSNYLFKLYRDLANGADDLGYMTQYLKVIKHTKEGNSPEGTKTKLFHILFLIDSKAGKNIDATAKKQYRAAATRARNLSMARTVENIATPEQVAMFLSVSDMRKQLTDGIDALFAEYGMDKTAKKVSADEFARWDIVSDRKNIKSFARDYQKLLMLACYILQPPLRSDWSSLEITSAAITKLAATRTGYRCSEAVRYASS